jgi:hypothetical protein
MTVARSRNAAQNGPSIDVDSFAFQTDTITFYGKHDLAEWPNTGGARTRAEVATLARELSRSAL